MRVMGQQDGRDVHALDLAAGGLSVTLLTRGSILRSVRLAGVAHDLTIGTDDLALYDGPMIYHGALVAPVGNRLAFARAPIDGRLVQLDGGKPHLLHSGDAGSHRKLWEVLGVAPDRATLAVTLPDGEGGFPGTRRVTATWEARAPATLCLTVTATTDKPTLMNPVNHSYWNLDGTPTWEGHTLQVAADRYVPVDAALIPTGVAEVAGTPYDFRERRAPRPGEPSLDHCLVTARAVGPLRDVLTLTGRSGVSMTLATTLPGVQVYDGSQAPSMPGRQLYEAFAIEAEMWPDAPNHAGFPPIALRPGETYEQVTEWRFAAP